jgi:hypothetical protein
MKIVINSHIKATIALNHLLESMKALEEFPNYEIIIMIGGYYHINNYEIEKVDNLTYIKCNHNSIDFTGLITLMELYNSNSNVDNNDNNDNNINIDIDINEHYFYMHDTCKVGPNFFKKLESIDLTNVSTIKINRWCSMNIGIYSQRIINQFKDFLLSKKNTDESRVLEFKSVNHQEDFIFYNDPNNTTLDNYWSRDHSEPVDYYKTGTMRVVEYYPNIDLYKIKANWEGFRGQPKWYLDV